MQTITLWGLLQFLLAVGGLATVLGSIILWLTDDNPLPGRVSKVVNGRRIWVNGLDSDVEFVHDPRDPAGKLRPEDFHKLEREEDVDRSGQ